jgi:chromosome partitioning protein
MIDADPTRALARWHGRAVERGSALGRATLIECVDDEEILGTIRSAAESHEYVLVDCAGTAARLLVYAAGTADVVVIPAQPGEADLVEAIKTTKIVQQAIDLTGRKNQYRVFLNRIDTRTHVGKHAVGQATSRGLPLFQSTWGDRVGFREGQYSGSSPVLDDAGSAAAVETVALAREIDDLIAVCSNEVMQQCRTA